MAKQDNLFDLYQETDNASVVCLGIEFENDDARREYFREELRKKLPELKKIDGFPIAEDEDIIELSDPPYYTACPNTWIKDFIFEWEKEKIEKYGRDVNEDYYREPFAADISEGKNDPIYNAHSYHTKVPYKAIMRYILQYTEPGDIIYDAFSGSGMTGVAAQMCEDLNQVRELGYSEQITKQITGKRHSILSDISPAATFIGYNYNKKANAHSVEVKFNTFLSKFRKNNQWKYKTFHLIDDKILEKLLNTSNANEIQEIIENYPNYFGEINYIVWSEVYICPNCTEEITYWEATVNKTDNSIVSKNMNCPHCAAIFEKKNAHRVFETHFDSFLNRAVEQPKIVMVKISYFTSDGKRAEKIPDCFDKHLSSVIQSQKFDNGEYITKIEFRRGSETDRLINQGINQVYDLYFPRALNNFGEYFAEVNGDSDFQFLFGSTIPKMTKLNRFMPQHKSRALVGPMANALYVPPLSVENNFIRQLEFQSKKIVKAYNGLESGLITTQSSTKIHIPDNSIDYMFFDPPFGANINYSELNFAREAWLKVITEDKYEAIENKKQGKSLDDYTELMSASFKEAYRILKPNKWITVEFSNTQASVWNALQHVIQNAGFIIASVAALDKKRGGFHAMITTTAVKQDLVISAYKPSEETIIKMKKESNQEDSAWTFIMQHLLKLPVFDGNKSEAKLIIERTPRILFDRMVAYHIQTGLPVPISSQDFQIGLLNRFPMRDGMVFLESQLAEYDKKRTLVKEFTQMSLFVSDENSAIEWIRQQLMKKPQTRQDLHPHYMKEIQHIAKHELLPELDDLLQQNFLRYEGDEDVPNQIAAYLRANYPNLRGLSENNPILIEKGMNRWYVPNPNKQADLEQLREKSLLREFDTYVVELEKSKKKLKQFRTEAIRVGFKKAYSEKNFEKIVKIGNGLPDKVIQEDDKLLMYYDNACIRLGL